MAVKKISYDRSFKSKLIQTTDENKAYYEGVLNYFKSFKKVKSRISWNYESVTLGRSTIAKVVLRGKTFSLYLALDPNEYVDSKYSFTDASGVKLFEKTPMWVKIKSKRGLKYAQELISNLAITYQIPFEKEVNGKYELAFKSDEELLEEGLIKVRNTGHKKVTSDEEIETEVVLEKETLKNDELEEASRLFVTKEKLAQMDNYINAKVLRPRHKAVINIALLNAAFDAYEVVSLETLLTKGLVSESCDYFKVLGTGSLSKPLLVIANGYSKSALNKINVQEGKAVTIR